MATKYKQVKINFTVEDHELLQKTAEKKGVSLAKLIRDHIGTKIEKEPKRRGKTVTNSIPIELLYEIKIQSRSLNRIAEYCELKNAIDRIVYDKLLDIEEVLKELLNDREY